MKRVQGLKKEKVTKNSKLYPLWHIYPKFFYDIKNSQIIFLLHEKPQTCFLVTYLPQILR